MKNISLIIIFFIAFISCNKRKVEEDPNVFYTCSMDPQVMEKKPGNCPICKMELTRTVISPNQDKESIKLSDTQMKLGNIITHKVEIGSIGLSLNLRGSIVVNERKVQSISSRVPGRVDKVYFKNPGQTISIGDRVYDIYSEELQAASKQYLLLKEKKELLKGGNINYTEMLRSARSKLHVWGMSENQIDHLTSKNTSNLTPFYSKVKGVVNEIMINEGEYVNEGTPILQVSDYSTLWVEVEVYPQDMKSIKVGLQANIIVEAFPNEVIEGKINFIQPELKAQSRINIVRIEIPNKQGKYKPGMRVTATVLLKEGSSLTVPEGAVLYQPDMNLVWVMKEEGLFVPKMVETGTSSKGKVEIKSGLSEGEVVVISGAYLIDSEYRLRKGSGEMPGMDHRDDDVAPAASGHQH